MKAGNIKISGTVFETFCRFNKVMQLMMTLDGVLRDDGNSDSSFDYRRGIISEIYEHLNYATDLVSDVDYVPNSVFVKMQEHRKKQLQAGDQQAKTPS